MNSRHEPFYKIEFNCGCVYKEQLSKDRIAELKQNHPDIKIRQVKAVD